MEEIKKFLEKENTEIKKLAKNLHSSYWEAIISGEEEKYKKYEKDSIGYKNYFNDKSRFEKIKEFLKITTDSLEKRQLEILYMVYLSCQGDKELMKKIIEKEANIEQIFNTFRAKIEEKELTDNEIKQILQNETDSEKLKQAWKASKKQGEIVEKELIELVKLRNELARSLGFENYYIMSLELDEQTEKEIEEIFIKMEETTAESFKKLKNEMDNVLSERYKIEKKELQPWHYQDLFFQEAPNVYDLDLEGIYGKDVIKASQKFYEDAGLDVKDILEKSDLYEKQGKYQHACCIDMDCEGDIRIVQNTKNNEHWAGTTLHELGHAVYCKGYTKTSLPFLLKGSAHTFTTEAIALLFERNIKNNLFLKKYYEINDEKLKKFEVQIKKSLQAEQLIFSKWSQVMFNFERELYKNPDQNLNKLWWDLINKYQKIDFYRDEPDWASKIHLASAPIYYHNYLLGKILASQLNNYIVKNILNETDIRNPDYSDKKVGDYLDKNIFIPGKMYRWDKLIEDATKEKLTSKYFIEEFAN